MSLDPRLIVAPSLQMVFRDKDTGLPLRAGEISFFKDQARTVPKYVYKISGSPPGYTYVALPNPLTLSSYGTVVDDTNADILPYWFPYDGTPDPGGSNNTIELYYAEVRNSAGVLQFVRQAWPNLSDNANIFTDAIKNFVPNGQFLLHNNLPVTSTLQAGQIRQAVTPIAYGGWYFSRPSGSTSIDFITFERFGSYTANPTGNPRYRLRSRCTSPSAGDTFKDIQLRYNDVNKFASTSQYYTYSLTARSNTGSNLACDIYLLKNYGTGGSSPTETLVQEITITPSYQIFNIPILFGTNVGKTIGTLDDDYLEIIIRKPTDLLSDIEIDDAILQLNNVTVTEFQTQTNPEFLYQSLPGFLPVPAADGSDLYLPIRLTQTGMEFDHSGVSKIYTASTSDLKVGELNCDGGQYLTSGYSSDGIPYSRLQAVLFNNTANAPIWGTGSNYVTSTNSSGSTDFLFINTNINGFVSPSTSGTTLFICTTGHTGSYYSLSAYVEGPVPSTSKVIAIGDVFGAVTDITAGTSGFTVEQSQNSPLSRQIFKILPIGASGLAGKYFKFSSIVLPSTLTNYYVWFKVNGVGSDPAPGGTGIQVNLGAGFDAYDMTLILANVLSGHNLSSLEIGGGGTIPAGSYFTFNTVASSFNSAFYVWFKVDGVGNDPVPPGRTGILVNINSADTVVVVRTKIIVAINSVYFATPDLRGVFLRGWDERFSTDPDGSTRYTLTGLNLLAGNQVGTYQQDILGQHLHGYIKTPFTSQNIAESGTNQGINVVSNENALTSYTGGLETRPINASVNYVIKY